MSGITLIRYTQNQKIGIPNHFKVFEKIYLPEMNEANFSGKLRNIYTVIKSPKQNLGDLLFLLRFLLLLFLFLFLFFSFLSVHHELVHGRSQELQDRIS